jgi:FkbM family methyltransferase
MNRFRAMRTGFRNWFLPSLLGYVAISFGERTPRLLRPLLDLRFTLRTRQGPRIRARLRDIGPPAEVFGLGEYDDPEFDWGRLRYVIDVGAHIGAFTIWVAARAPNCQVFAIEPNPEAIELLKQNLDSAGISARVRVLEAAVAGVSGQREFSITTMSPSATLLPVAERSAACAVTAITLAAAIVESGFPSVDLLKIDVEGAEEEIFVELDPATLAPVQALLIECHPPAAHRLANLIEPVLDRAGFSVSWRPKRSHGLLIGRRQATEQKGRMANGLA